MAIDGWLKAEGVPCANRGPGENCWVRLGQKTTAGEDEE